MVSLKEVRKQQYDYHKKDEYRDLNEWKKSPYTWLKARFYMELSAVAVYLLLKTRIKPNHVTIFYGLLGLLGGILLAIPTNTTIILAVLIFFSKGVLDWSDGHYARMVKQTSVTGAILDPYAGVVGALAFQMGLGFYAAHKSGIVIFYWLTALIPFFYALRLHTYTRSMLFKEHMTPKKIKEYSQKDAHGRVVEFDGYKSNKEALAGTLGGKYSGLLGRLYSFFKKYPDNRAKTVDFVCLLLLLELFTPIFITWVVFLGFAIREFLIFSASFYIILKDNWAEKQLISISKKVSNVKDEKEDFTYISKS